MKFRFSWIVIALSACIFTAILIYFSFNDFWQDEIYTITHFVLVPIRTTLTDYHTTNNHIFFNLLANLYRNIFSWNDLSYVLIHPFLLRILPLIFSLLNVLVFYRLTHKHYGKIPAMIGVSFWVTTISIIGFGAQFRGYSLNILVCTFQYFIFLRSLKEESITWRTMLVLLVVFLISLLVIPTNIYLILSYLSFSSIMILKPSLGVWFVDKKVDPINMFKIACSILTGVIIAVLYYKWLLYFQPPNKLITGYSLFSFQNLRELLTTFYHFSYIRFYIYLAVIICIIQSIKKIRHAPSLCSSTFLPAFLFFLPFLFFFIHGTMIIQRAFLCLIPVFVLFIALSTYEAIENIKLINAIVLLNMLSIIISIALLFSRSKDQNKQSLHYQDLINHYYLVDFNAKQSTLLAKQIINQKKTSLYLYDDFGGTGIDYYLKEFNVPYKLYNDTIKESSDFIILTNNKKEIERSLKKEKISFYKLLSDEYQYNIFYCSLHNFKN